MEDILFHGKGYVLHWGKGYGFVKITHVEDEGEFFEDPLKGDAFVHYKNIQGMSGFKALCENQVVEFDVIKKGEKKDGESKLAAINVYPLTFIGGHLKGEPSGNR